MNKLFIGEELSDKRHDDGWSSIEEETKLIAYVSPASESIFKGFRPLVAKDENRHLFPDVWTSLSAKWDKEQSLKQGTTMRTRPNAREVKFDH